MIGYNFTIVLLINDFFEFAFERLYNFLEVCDY